MAFTNPINKYINEILQEISLAGFFGNYILQAI